MIMELLALIGLVVVILLFVFAVIKIQELFSSVSELKEFNKRAVNTYRIVALEMEIRELREAVKSKKRGK
jgi:sensor histidine kinase regulating citrate/malate metabolism